MLAVLFHLSPRDVAILAEFRVGAYGVRLIGIGGDLKYANRPWLFMKASLKERERYSAPSSEQIRVLF